MMAGDAALDRPIPYGHQEIDEDDIAAVVEVLRSDLITQGPAVQRFERAVADYCGVPYAVAVCNGTAALHLAYLAAGLGPGDVGWTSPNTFVASANAMLYCGARADFVDIDPQTWNMDVAALTARLERGERPKLLVPVHFAGLPCDMERIADLARTYGFAVIEDACHAFGGRYQEVPVGACTHSDMAVFSFHPVKSITTGEGGMILTRRRDVYERLLRLRSHGITRDPKQMEGEDQAVWAYQQLELGFNCRITDIQAALGANQLKRLDVFVARRTTLVERYDRLLERLPVLRQQRPEGVASAHHLYPIRLAAGVDRRRVVDAMRAVGVEASVHYIPVYTQPYYRRLGFRAGYCPEAERYFHGAVTLPLYPALTESMQDRVVAGLEHALLLGE